MMKNLRTRILLHWIIASAIITAVVSFKEPSSIAGDFKKLDWIAKFYTKDKNAVVLRWDFYDRNIPHNYKILRKKLNEEEFSDLSLVNAPLYYDREIFLGDIYTYSVEVIVDGKVVGGTDERSVAIPTSGVQEKGNIMPPAWADSTVELYHGWDKNYCNVLLEWKHPSPDNRQQVMAYTVYRKEGTSGEYSLRLHVGREELKLLDYHIFARYRSREWLFTYAITALYGSSFVESALSDERVVACKYFGMGEQTDQKMVNILNKALNSGDSLLSKMAYIVIEPEKKDRLSVEELQAALYSDNYDVRWVSLMALGQLKSPDAIKALSIAFEVEDPLFREAALRFIEGK